MIPQNAASIDSNSMVAFVAGDCTLYVFPDGYFVRTAYGLRSLGKNLNVEVRSCSFREEEDSPGDSELVGFTWRYIKRDGGPDLRFSGNRKIPIYRYGEVILTSEERFRLHLTLSQAWIAFRFVELLNTAKKDQKTTRAEERASGAHSASKACGATAAGVDNALRLLELNRCIVGRCFGRLSPVC